MRIYWDNIWYGGKEHYRTLYLETKNNNWCLLKVKAKLNETNSSLMVRCYASEKCGLRRTCICDTCEYNHGAEEEKSFYRPR